MSKTFAPLVFTCASLASYIVTCPMARGFFAPYRLFLFGLMTVPLSPVWDDSVEAMKAVAQHKTGEETLGRSGL